MAGHIITDDADKPVKRSKNDEPWHWEYIKPGIEIKK